MKDNELQLEGVETLMALGAVLIPQTFLMPAADKVKDAIYWLGRAASGSGYSATDIQESINSIPPTVNWESARKLAELEPKRFALLSTLISAAYYMNPEVLKLLGYPADRRNPAGPEDFLNEYETGIMEKISNRPPQYRKP